MRGFAIEMSVWLFGISHRSWDVGSSQIPATTTQASAHMHHRLMAADITDPRWHAVLRILSRNATDMLINRFARACSPLSGHLSWPHSQLWNSKPQQHSHGTWCKLSSWRMTLEPSLQRRCQAHHNFYEAGKETARQTKTRDTEPRRVGTQR